MGKGSTSMESTGKNMALAQAMVGMKDWKMRKPLLENVINRSNEFLTTGDISNSMYFDPVHNAVSNQLRIAQNNALENMPVGGGLYEELNNQYLQGAQSIIDQVIMKEYQDALALASPGVTFALQGLGNAGNQLAGLSGAQANRAAAEGQNYAAIGEGVESLGSAGSACCFIFIAAHGYLHPVVRRYRDEHMTVQNRRGYYWLADRLVPRMKKHRIIKEAVKFFMVLPMTEYGKYVYGYNRIGVLFKPVAKFWLKVYEILGDRPPYKRRGSLEVV